MPKAVNGMKQCTRCRDTKPVSEFYRNSSRSDGLNHICKVCFKFWKKSRSKEQNQQWYLTRVNFVNAQKTKPCMDCEIQYPFYVMDFDHRPGELKLGNIASLIRSKVALEILQKEIDKCDLVCANCHRERTWRRSKEDSGD